MITEMYADIKHMKIVIAGNGNEGLVKQTNRHDKIITETRAQIKLVKWFVGGGFFITIASWIKIIFGGS